MSVRQQGFDIALGDRLRSLRQEQGLTCEEVSSRLAEYGVTMSRVTVGNTEHGQRSASAYELTVFPRVFEVSLAQLLDGLPAPGPVAAGLDEATVKAARRLEADPGEVDVAARRLWGRGLIAERDARLGDATRSRVDQARRGHVTRTLIEELRAAAGERPDPRSSI